MSGPRLNLIALVGSLLVLVAALAVGPAVEERARGRGGWNRAFLVAPGLQAGLAVISLSAVAVALRRGRLTETVFGTTIVLLVSVLIIEAGVGAFQRYSHAADLRLGRPSAATIARPGGGALA